MLPNRLLQNLPSGLQFIVDRLLEGANRTLGQHAHCALVMLTPTFVLLPVLVSEKTL